MRHLKEYYKEWYRLYGDLAIELEKQGYIVFVSSNIQVIKYLTERNADFSVIIYSNNLKKFAIEKMQKRYSSGLKDGSLEELNTIKENFIMNNNKIRQWCKNNKIKLIILDNIDYDLEGIVKGLINI